MLERAGAGEADLIVAIGSRFDDRTTGILNKYAPEAYRKCPHTKHEPQVRDPRGRRKTKKRWKDGRARRQDQLTKKEVQVRHRPKRGPNGPVTAGGSVSSTHTTAGKGSTYQYA